MSRRTGIQKESGEMMGPRDEYDLRWKSSRKIRTESEHALALRKNEGFEHVGAVLLVRGEQLQQVRHRNHAAIALFSVDDQEVKDPVLIHQSETVLDRCLRGRGHKLPRHDFGNAHPCGALILGRHFVGNVALRGDPEENSLFVADADGAHLAVPEIAGSIVDGGVFRNRIDFTPRRYEVRYPHRTLLNCQTEVILGRLCLGTQLILSATPLDRFNPEFPILIPPMNMDDDECWKVRSEISNWKSGLSCASSSGYI